VVGGLAVAPFLLHRYRKRSLEDMLHALQYSPFKVEGTEFLADVSPEQVKEAFDLFFRERDSWLTFRKFSGNVTLLQGDSAEKIEALLTFEWLPSKGDFPRMGKFTCKDPVSKKQLWTYTMESGNKNSFDGEDTKKELVPSLEAFMFPLMLMYSLSNDRMVEAFQTNFKVSLNPEAKGVPRSYAFKPIDTEADRGSFLIRDGRLYVISPQRQGSTGGIQWEGFDWQSFGKLHFPSKIEMSELTYKKDGSFERRLLMTHVFGDFTVS